MFIRVRIDKRLSSGVIVYSKGRLVSIERKQDNSKGVQVSRLKRKKLSIGRKKKQTRQQGRTRDLEYMEIISLSKI